MMLGLALLSASAVRAQDAAPGANREGVVHVDAMKNPEMRSYRAIAAGLDAFDEFHALAPAVPKLLFSVRPRDGAVPDGQPQTARLSGDDFSLALPVDADGLFAMPRSQQAWDANAELIMDRKPRELRLWPWVRTPGLPENQRRLGDLRLECKVFVAIAKKEAPFYMVALANTALLTSDWCGFFKDQGRQWTERVPAPLAGAVLREGDRRLALRVRGRKFELPIADAGWSNDAIIDLEFAPAAPATTSTKGQQ
jgi:hypothetical protein